MIPDYVWHNQISRVFISKISFIQTFKITVRKIPDHGEL